MCTGTAAAGGSCWKNHHEQPRRARAKGREEALHLRKQHLFVHAVDAFAFMPVFKDVLNFGQRKVASHYN